MCQSRPYLITLSSDTDGIHRFLDSLENIDVEYIPVQFEPKTAGLKSFREFDFAYPGHREKYNYAPRGLDEDRMIIYADTDDVVFQRGLPELTEDIYLAPENINHRDTIYKDTMLRHSEFSNLGPVYNSGLYAMRVPIFYEWVDYVTTFPVKTRLNQLIFNQFVLGRDFVADRTLFLPLFANIYSGAEKIDNTWMVDGMAAVAVHGNGSTRSKL